MFNMFQNILAFLARHMQIDSRKYKETFLHFIPVRITVS